MPFLRTCFLDRESHRANRHLAEARFVHLFLEHMAFLRHQVFRQQRQDGLNQPLQDFLQKSHYEPTKEIYLRRLLWWAYNDLHRNHQHIRLRYFLNGFMSFGVWHCNRSLIIEGEKLFFKNLNGFTENLKRLQVLLEKHPEEQIDLEMPEIYRELRQFDKAKELLDQVGSRTHFTNEMIRHSKWKDPRVFMVSG